MQKLVRETYQQLLLSKNKKVQSAAFACVLEASSQLLSSMLSPAEDQLDDAKLGLEEPGQTLQSSDPNTFKEDAELLRAVITARPDPFATVAFNQLVRITLQKGDLSPPGASKLADRAAALSCLPCRLLVL